jgi:predicted P-loop ATPase
MEVFTRVVKAEAREHKVHPIRDYLARLQWDRIPRLDRWLTTYGQAKDTTYVRAVGALVLIAAVRRVRQPGCKFDEFLILISNQGLNKSTALRTLCPDDSWFSDDLPLGVDAKGVIERTRAKWLIEASDLQGYARSQVEHLKAMLSRQTDGPARLAYARESVEVHRQFVLVGTTNHGQFLRDRTGNRRFWPVQVKSFDIPALLRDRDQLWAEAAHREAAGESIRLTRELWPVAACEQAARQVEDRWADILREVLVVDGKLADRIVLGTVWDALGISVDRSDERASERVNAIMQSLGYEKKNARGKTDGDTRVAKRWCLTGQPEQLDIVEEPAPLKEEKM